MNRSHVAFGLAVVLMAASAARAEEAKSPEASIFFANHGGIQD